MVLQEEIPNENPQKKARNNQKSPKNGDLFWVFFWSLPQNLEHIVHMFMSKYRWVYARVCVRLCLTFLGFQTAGYFTVWDHAALQVYVFFDASSSSEQFQKDAAQQWDIPFYQLPQIVQLLYHQILQTYLH